jgi:hypothetical protein
MVFFIFIAVILFEFVCFSLCISFVRLKVQSHFSFYFVEGGNIKQWAASNNIPDTWNLQYVQYGKEV